MTKLVFVDVETTGLDPARHEIWDVGIIVGDSEDQDAHEEYQCYLPVELKTAEPMALKVGKFYERHPHYNAEAKPSAWEDELVFNNKVGILPPVKAAHDIARMVADSHLVGNVVSFDAAFLDKFLRANGVAPSWHYHLVDCEALVAGALGVPPPWKSPALSRAIGVEPPTVEEAHSALRDAKWSMELYWAAMERYSGFHRDEPGIGWNSLEDPA